MRKFPIGIQLLADELSSVTRVEKFFSATESLLPFTHAVVSARSSDLLEVCIREAHDKGAKVFFWKQMFHEIGSRREDPQQLVGFDLAPINKSWICPNNVESTTSLIGEARSILDSHDVDGLFIDVFRYPSPCEGLTSLLSCFCDSCMTKAREIDVDLDETRIAITDFVEKIRAICSDKITTLKKEFGRSFVFDWVSCAPHILNFSKLRSYSINHFVENVNLLVKESGRELGLDIFSPSISLLVGQDYSLLKDNCSWMKPMVYCAARGTACLPAEIASLARDLQRLNPRLSDKDLIHMIRCFLELPLRHKDLTDIVDRGFPEELVRLETARAKEAVESRVPIYTGIESMVTDICSAGSERVESYMKNAVDGGADGIILSWDVALAPKENLEAAKRFLASKRIS